MAAAARIPLHRALAAHVRGALAAPPRRAGPTALSGASLLAALVYASSSETASCDGAAAPPTAPLRPLPGSGADESQSRRQLREALDSGYLAGITAFGGFAIVTILLLAWRTEARSSRAYAFVAQADALLNRSPAVVSRVGRVVSSGAYQLAFEPARVEGCYTIESPTRRLAGRAYVSGVRSSAAAARDAGALARLLPRSSSPADAVPDWDITSLRVEFDRAELQAADVRRAAMSAAAGYRRPEEVEGAAADAAAGDAHNDDGTKVVMQLV